MTDKPYFVLLTGDKSNSGDHLIKESAIALFRQFRSDREIVTFPGWEKFDTQRLDIINQSKALILCGGPSIRMHLFGDVYPLTENIQNIKVPIILFGSGYRDSNGDWASTIGFEFSKKTHQLLTKINESGYLSSVRCYHTLNCIKSQGYKNFVMSGCPAFYELDHIEQQFPKEINVRKIAFATGRKYITLPGMDLQQKELILFLSKKFKDRKFTVAFHDPINKRHQKTTELLDFLALHNIDHVDISGTADKLKEFYNDCDAQIGYRVHAHIYMSSIQKPSILLAEDSRAKGIKSSLPGVILDTYKYQTLNRVQRVLNKLKKKGFFFAAQPLPNISDDVWLQWQDEESNNWKRNRVANWSIKEHFETMKLMLSQLP
jgi:hypothetical protein